jgi:hypothetical protein
VPGTYDLVLGHHTRTRRHLIQVVDDTRPATATVPATATSRTAYSSTPVVERW